MALQWEREYTAEGLSEGQTDQQALLQVLWHQLPQIILEAVPTYSQKGTKFLCCREHIKNVAPKVRDHGFGLLTDLKKEKKKGKTA